MKELIAALRACFEIAVSCNTITDAQAKLVAEHVESLVDTTIRNDAMKYITAMLNDHVVIPHDTAAGALAKVCVMLVPYGSKSDAILAVIHDKGWGVVTLDDVQAVRTFILEQ